MEYKKSFSILQAFRYAFETLFKEFLFFVKVFFVNFLLLQFGSWVVFPKLTSLIQAAIETRTIQPHILLGIITTILLAIVLRTLAAWGIDEVCLEFVTTGKKSLNMMLNPFSYVLKALAADATFVALFLGTFAVCCVPTLYALKLLGRIAVMYIPIEYLADPVMFYYKGLMVYNSIIFLATVLLCAGAALYVFTVFCFYRYIIIDTQCSIIEAFRKSADLTKGVRFALLGLSILVIVLNSVRMIPVVGSFFIDPVRILTSMDIYKKLRDAKNNPEITFTNMPGL